MDKNFISIDDLVRQRLEGGEAQERSGAWLQMRDVLDKEMPQEKDRAGFFFWRRMMSAIAVLLVIASISVGGYELSATRGSGTAANNTVALPAQTTANAPANNEVSNTQITSTGVAENDQPKNNHSNKQALIAANNQHQNKEHKRATVKTAAPVVNTPAVAANTQKAATPSEPANSKSPDATAIVAATTPVKTLAATEDAGSNDVVNVNDNDAVKTKTKATHTRTHTKATAQAAATAKQDVATATPAVAKDNANIKPVAKTAAKTSKPAAKTTGKVAITKKAPIAVPVATANKAKESKAKQQKMEALALGSSLTNTASPKVGKAKKPVISQDAVANAVSNKIVAGNTAIPANKKNTKAAIVAADKTAATKNTSANNDNAVSNNVTATTQPVPAGAVAAVAAPKVAVPVKTVTPAENPALKNTYAINVKKGKRVIQKLVLYDHHLKTEPGDDQHILDTISMETLTQELGSAAENSPYIPSPANKSAARQAVTNTATTTATTGNNSIAASGVTSTASNTNAQILPGAAASAIAKPAAGSASKQSAGATALENLNSTFNDIKYHVKGVQFAPGLSAGINGTFFGPSSFKGFQFGVTGDFVFGDLSLCTALTYFHRVNNNYSLENDYYTYTPTGQNTYTRQQIASSYAFSTLHSLEMPLIIKYTAGKFNVFIGGNIVYSFSINEGETMPQPTGTTSVVGAKGNDENPKVSAADFDSRFGFGCLFGVSYKVAPNVTIDIRNVMTLWDNANTSGSKYVSGQLYKSPSLQLSLGYRLGGNKAK